MIKLLYIEDNDDNIYMLKMRLELLDEFEVLGSKLINFSDPTIRS